MPFTDLFTEADDTELSARDLDVKRSYAEVLKDNCLLMVEPPKAIAGEAKSEPLKARDAINKPNLPTLTPQQVYDHKNLCLPQGGNQDWCKVCLRERYEESYKEVVDREYKTETTGAFKNPRKSIIVTKEPIKFNRPEGARKIPVHKDGVVYVYAYCDEEDFEDLMQYTWYLSVNHKCPMRSGVLESMQLYLKKKWGIVERTRSFDGNKMNCCRSNFKTKSLSPRQVEPTKNSGNVNPNHQDGPNL